jgi:ionotropic glutamate receptor
MQAFQKGSPIAKDFSKSILRLLENGNLTRLEDKWLSTPSNECSVNIVTSNSTEHLSLQSFWGLYLISGAVSTICFLLSLIRLLKNYQHQQEADKGNATPSKTSAWNKALRLARFLYNGEINIPGIARTLAPTMVRGEWSSSRSWVFVSTTDTPDNIHASASAELKLHKTFYILNAPCTKGSCHV